jgi:hypothetical protein
MDEGYQSLSPQARRLASGLGEVIEERLYLRLSVFICG